MRVRIFTFRALPKKLIHALVIAFARFINAHDDIKTVNTLLHLIHQSDDESLLHSPHGDTQI